MQTLLIQKCLREIEEKLDWGESANWTHQDFLNLSDRILEETGKPLSYVTLKRVWGKVSYHSLPNANTLNTLAIFLGYDSWREFEFSNNGKEEKPLEVKPILNTKRPNWRLIGKVIGFAALLLFVILIIPGAKDRPKLNPDDFSFTSKKVVSQGIPNSVVFNIDALKSPYDSVEVQQSWDRRLRTKLPKEQQQHTSIYYYPGFFEAKLVVGDEIVKEHSLHITTDGWYCAVQTQPVPVYFPVEKIQGEGRLELRPENLSGHHINLQPQPPISRIGNVREFGDLKSDHFVFEARFRNTYREGSAVCQHSRVYLLCAGNVIWVDLMAPGCISSASLNFINHHASGKEKDLSAFGVDFSKDIFLRMHCQDGKANIFLNNELVYSIKERIDPVAIKGVDFRFEGLGAVDEVKLGKPNGEWVLWEEF